MRLIRLDANTLRDLAVFSSHEPKAHRLWLIGEPIGYSWSGVRGRRGRRDHGRQQSQTSSPLKPLANQSRFYVEPPCEGGTKVYINGPGQMTKMAAMPIYGKNL